MNSVQKSYRCSVCSVPAEASNTELESERVSMLNSDADELMAEVRNGHVHFYVAHHAQLYQRVSRKFDPSLSSSLILEMQPGPNPVRFDGRAFVLLPHRLRGGIKE